MSRRLALVIVLALASVLPTTPAPAGDEEVVAVRSLSNRADLVSGGDVLLEVTVPGDADLGDLAVDVDGRDITEAFALREDGRYYGRVEGLVDGANLVTAQLPDGRGATLEVTNHPIGGPVFSGPQVQPWLCTTADAGLGEPLDEQCNAEPVISYSYWSVSDGAFAPYDPESPPDESDIATTTTDEGHEVPYIVRREDGALNRGVYSVAVLFDPAQPWEPWAQQVAWNNKLFYPFGASCNTNYGQGPLNDVMLDMALSKGFAVASSSLNILGHVCNTVLSAETVMMLKEHIVETYGEIRYTFGEGNSGGSIGQLQVTNAYPGLLQGLIPSQTYPDLWTTITEVLDCDLLLTYFTASSPQMWVDPAHQTAVNGHMGQSSCVAWEGTFVPVSDPRHGCGTAAGSVPVPTASVRGPDDYDPVLNPEGCRATIQDMQVAVWGTREEDGFAKRPFDNEGVQYGLRALQEGIISAAQFVDLNAGIGGLDIDLNHTAERSMADPGTPLIAYAGSQVNDGRGLAGTAIIDLPATMNVEIHTPYHAFSIEDRLTTANGHADNHAIWRGGPAGLAFETMDAWLAAIEADTSDATLEEKVVDNRPDIAVDSCFIDGIQETEIEACDTAWPYFGDARIAAGSGIASDQMKCTLVPLDRETYELEESGDPVVFTDTQWAELQSAFPHGVCDWEQAGVDQVPTRQWLTFASGPGGEPLGDAPVSIPFGADTVQVVRHGGTGRIETAVAVSGRGLAEATTVVLARADEYADALAGAPLAVTLEAPLLLTDREALSQATANEITRLGATEAVLLGGEVALHPQVAADLEVLGVTVRRVAGSSRFGTAAALAAELPPGGEALLVRADGFADAVSASALGAALGLPILLVSQDDLPQETSDLLAGLDATIVGGTAAVGADVADAVDAVAGDVGRLSGDDRYATSLAVALEALARGLSPATTWLATGVDFPDALVAGAAAGHAGGVLLLVDGSDLDGSPEVAGFLTEHLDDLEVVRLAGGDAAIAPSVEDAIVELVGS